LKRLRSALIGLTGVGADYLSALRLDDAFDLVAVADGNREVLRRCTEGTSLNAFEDYRSLIVENANSGLDLLFVGLEPFESIEFVEMAADRGIGVFHKAPFARSAEEAGRILARFGAKKCSLVVSRYWQFEPAFAELADLSELVGGVYAATACVQTCDSSDGWQGDSMRAGGGVLLNGAYEVVDMFVALLGMPESVYAQCANRPSSSSVRKHDTEDTAALSLRFQGDRIASVTAWRGGPEADWRVTLAGTNGTVELRPDRMTIAHGRERPPECINVQTKNPVAAAMRAFALACSSDSRPLPSPGAEHLKTLATIDAAYLSARTASPEAPGRFLR